MLKQIQQAAIHVIVMSDPLALLYLYAAVKCVLFSIVVGTEYT